MTARERVRARIRARAAVIQQQRESGASWWAQLRRWFDSFDKLVIEHAVNTQAQHLESQSNFNRAFDRHGASERDLLPGGRVDMRRRWASRT